MYQQDLARAVAAEMLADPLASRPVANLPVSYGQDAGSRSWLLPFVVGGLTGGTTALLAVLPSRRV